MSVRDLTFAITLVATALLSSGCMNEAVNMVAPGITVLDTQTLKTISHREDASLEVEAPWGPHDAETILPGSLTDKTFRTIYTSTGGWCVREFERDGSQLSTRTLPQITLHSLTEQYALAHQFDRAVFVDDDSANVNLYDLKSGKTRALLENAIENPFSVEWMLFVDENTVSMFVHSADEGAYGGSVALIPLGNGKPRVLFKHPELWGAALSPDMKHLAAVLSFMHPKPDEFILVDLDNGSQQPISTLTQEGEDIYITDIAWSPDGKSIAFGCEMNVELYSLDTRTTRVLKRTPNTNKGMILGMSFLDKSRLYYLYSEREHGPEQLEILDVTTGKVLVSRSLISCSRLQVFDNGNRIAVEGK